MKYTIVELRDEQYAKRMYNMTHKVVFHGIKIPQSRLFELNGTFLSEARYILEVITSGLGPGASLNPKMKGDCPDWPWGFGIFWSSVIYIKDVDEFESVMTQYKLTSET